MKKNIMVIGEFNIDAIPVLTEIFPEYTFYTGDTLRRGMRMDLFIFSAKKMLRYQPREYIKAYKEEYGTTAAKILITSVDPDMLKKVATLGDKSIMNPCVSPHSCENIETKRLRQKQVFKEAIDALFT